MILQLEIEYEDGTKEMIVSDNSWKTTTGPLLHDAIFTGKFMMLVKIWDIGIESPMMIIYGNQHYKSDRLPVH